MIFSPRWVTHSWGLGQGIWTVPAVGASLVVAVMGGCCVCGCRRYLLRTAKRHRGRQMKLPPASCLPVLEWEVRLTADCLPAHNGAQVTNKSTTGPTDEANGDATRSRRPSKVLRRLRAILLPARPDLDARIISMSMWRGREDEENKVVGATAANDARRGEMRRERAHHTARQPTCERGDAHWTWPLVDALEAGSLPRWLTSAMTSSTSTSQ